MLRPRAAPIPAAGGSVVAFDKRPAGSRMRDLATSMAAVLVAQGCNLGFAPIVKPGHPL